MPLKGIYILFLGVFFLLTISCRPSEKKTITLEQANSLIKQADGDLSEQNYLAALQGFESALVYYKNFQPNGSKVDELRAKIRQTKAMSLVSHFQAVENQNEDDADKQLLPKTLEAKDFRVLQLYGNPVLKRKWTDRKLQKSGEFVGKGRKFTLFLKDGVELFLDNKHHQTLRSCGPAGFTLWENSVTEISSGIYLISGKNLPAEGWFFSYPIGQFYLRTDEAFAVMIETTTNGGCKIISLVGTTELIMDSGVRSIISPGELTFLMRDEFSVKMNIELSTFIGTSKLFSEFASPPPMHKKMRQQALIQALRTKKHYRALVGDAKTLDDFEVQILKEEDAFKDSGD